MSRLRRWKKRRFSLLIPALTRWANLYRASGAEQGSHALRLDLSAHSAASRKRAPEARHPLAQPVRAGLECKKIMSTVGAAPNQKHISDQTRLRVFSTTQQTPHQNPFSCDEIGRAHV